MAALYRAADIMVVTPLRDGMNLVAKEYVACRLRVTAPWCSRSSPVPPTSCEQAWLVNPYDINGMKPALQAAYHADPKDIGRRMKAMRKTVLEKDVALWARKFLESLAAVRPTHGKVVRAAKES